MPLNTLQDIIDDTKRRLNEAQNTPAGALMSGTGTQVSPTDDAITALTNEAIGDLCRFGGLAVPETATGTTVAGAGFVPYFLLMLTSNNVLWAARDVAYAGARLTWIAPGLHVQKYNVGIAGGTPAEWSRLGTEGIALGPVPVAAGALTVRGLSILKALSAPTDLLSAFLPPDLRPLLSYRNAYFLALKNKEDPTLRGVMGDWLAEYERGKAKQLSHLRRLDPTTYDAFYGGGAG